ncbi:MAG: hypothetical protein P1U85_13175 [Verrucomicrobiales bacterium]|jgi:hypothetical protein|nr:hypothetical protein [Verrucomicrobiales bacterium]
MNQVSISFLSLLLLASCGSVSAEGLAATKRGTPIDLTTQELGPEVSLDSANPDHAIIRVSGENEKQKTLHLFDLDRPIIETESYAITGEVRYEGIEGDGFLEMWNHLPGEAGETDIAVSFFSRTLGISGPMGKLTGTSDWRPFQLPAYVSDDSGRRPLRLTLNVVLPGKGNVEIRNLKLRSLRTPRTFSPWMIQSAIGMSIAAFVLGVVAITFFFVLRKRRSANELRRIQALDS